MPGEKKSVVFPLLGALLLGPGAVTFSFARHEATKLGSDWVYISTPLLLVGGLCVVLAFYRLLDVVGLAIGGALVVAGWVYAFVTLSRAIHQREEYQRERVAFDEMSKLCEGKGEGNARAVAYDPDVAGRYTGAFFEGSEKAAFRSVYDKELESFRTARPFITETALVACLVEEENQLQACQYTGSATLHRVRVDLHVTLYSAKTGEVVHEATLKGGGPRACAASEEFYGQGAATSSITGEKPTKAALVEELRPFFDVR